MRRQMLLGAVGFVLALMVGLPASANAHSTAFYTGGGGLWPTYSGVYYKVRQGFPTVAYYNRIEDGGNQWNAAGTSSGIEPDFYYNGSTTVTGNADAPCSATYNGIYWRDLDYLGSGVLGYTPHCENSSGVVTRFSFSVDSDRTWYTGTGTATSWDLWSLTTHEFGHATGWYGHFSPGESICDNTASQATMCPEYFPNTVRMRTLDDHSKHTFVAAY